MNHAGATHFDPARLFADAAARAVAFETSVINLSARFDEGKVRRAKARLRIGAEQSADEFFDRAFEVAERNALVHQQAFDLIEHRVVRGVWRIAAKHAARRGDAQRRTPFLHGVNLHRRSLRTQRKRFFIAGSREIKRILRAARRMVVRNVQRGEVIKRRFNFGAVFDLVTHRNKDVFDALAQERDRMQMSGGKTASGQRYVNVFFDELRGFALVGETVEQLVNFGFDVIFEFVELRACGLALFGRELAERFHLDGDESGFAPYPTVAQGCGFSVSGDSGKLGGELRA